MTDEETDKWVAFRQNRKEHELTMFNNLKARLPQLKELLTKVNGHWASEDLVYRFYHHSYKVQYLQEHTKDIVDALQNLLPGAELNKMFMEIISEGTGKTFVMDWNKQWMKETRPIVEAFFHARYFLEMGIRYGEELDNPVSRLPSGWASFLYLYNLR